LLPFPKSQKQQQQASGARVNPACLLSVAFLTTLITEKSEKIELSNHCTVDACASATPSFHRSVQKCKTLYFSEENVLRYDASSVKRLAGG
jgi:hypothetical protein